MSGSASAGWAPIEFTDFEHQVARRPRVRAELEDLARHTIDWSDVRCFCDDEGVTFREVLDPA